MQRVDKKEYRFDYKNISCEIIFWTTDCMKEDENNTYKAKGIWNSYFFLKKDKMSKEDFKKINLRVKRNKFGRAITNSFKLETDDFIEMSGGVTFYGKKFDNFGKLFCIQIGNDYNHIWNTGFEDYESIKMDLEETIDKFLNKVKYKQEKKK